MAPPLVLVVDDDILVRIDTAAMFEEAGFEVIEACDVAGALAALRETGLQLVCTDVHMPGDLDGIDLARHVREHHPNTGVIVVSGYTDKRAIPLSIPFLEKPFRSMRLLDLARQQLRAPAFGEAGP